jgi:hypothetical protein
MEIKSFYLFVLIIIMVGCNNTKKTEITDIENDTINSFIHPNTTTYYQTKTDDQAIVVAETIVYDVVIQNSQYGNEWQNECTYYTYASNVDVEAFANIIFQAVYEGRLIPYSIMRDGTMTLDEVKELEKDNKRNSIAKLEFTETWYFNENTLQMSKKISEIAFGFERLNEAGEVLSYNPAFKVYLDNPEKNAIAK